MFTSPSSVGFTCNFPSNSHWLWFMPTSMMARFYLCRGLKPISELVKIHGGLRTLIASFTYMFSSMPCIIFQGSVSFLVFLQSMYNFVWKNSFSFLSNTVLRRTQIEIFMISWCHCFVLDLDFFLSYRTGTNGLHWRILNCSLKLSRIVGLIFKHYCN